jgi:hypothetical protein
MGRPWKVTDIVAKRIVELFHKGLRRPAIAQDVNVSLSSVKRILILANVTEKAHPAFSRVNVHCPACGSGRVWLIRTAQRKFGPPTRLFVCAEPLCKRHFREHYLTREQRTRPRRKTNPRCPGCGRRTRISSSSKVRNWIMFQCTNCGIGFRPHTAHRVPARLRERFAGIPSSLSAVHQVQS